MPRNPFEQLYVSEQVQPTEFVEIFSSALVEHAMPLFQPGHVILSGVQGSGKTMLFKLLEAEVRLAYAKARTDFPISEHASRFVGAKININTSRAKQFGSRRSVGHEGIQELMFGDFVNYVVAIDMIRSVHLLASDAGVANYLGIDGSSGKWEEFARSVAGDDTWEGYLESASGFEALMERMRARLHLYRRYMNANDLDLDSAVASSKTSPGDPLKKLVDHFRESEIVEGSTNFYVVIDQYEELAAIRTPDGYRADYRGVINRMLSNRDPTLSYRIGTRGYGWRNHLGIHGTDAQLERDRDYKLIELDVKLRQQEDRSSSIFPGFAEDVFDRRLRHTARLEGRPERKVPIAEVLGHSLAPTAEARILARQKPERALRIESQWPQHVQSMLKRLAQKDPLSARLGEAWIRQKGWDEPRFAGDPPWEKPKKAYWRKERVEVALLQIAGTYKQRAILSGREDVLGLSGGNILWFLSICQYIWDFASQATEREDGRPEIPIRHSLQTIGIFSCARGWLDSLSADYGRSQDRFRLVQKLGEMFSTRLLRDRKISNPGHNGISLVYDDLIKRPDIFGFLIEAVDYGNLIMTEHATRNKDRRRRIKFYLNPLYCPIYRIPYQRTKEPIYMSVLELEDWLAEAGIIPVPSRPKVARQRRGPTAAPLLDRLNSASE